jgi:hypothetical protein
VGAPTDAEVKANLARARLWLLWLIEREADYAFCASWLPYLDVLTDDNGPMRARGMRDNCAMVARCDGIVLCGGRLSSGMDAELARFKLTRPGMMAAHGVADLTSLGAEPPAAWGREDLRTPIAEGRRLWRRANNIPDPPRSQEERVS